MNKTLSTIAKKNLLENFLHENIFRCYNVADLETRKFQKNNPWPIWEESSYFINCDGNYLISFKQLSDWLGCTVWPENNREKLRKKLHSDDYLKNLLFRISDSGKRIQYAEKLGLTGYVHLTSSLNLYTPEAVWYIFNNENYNFGLNDIHTKFKKYQESLNNGISKSRQSGQPVLPRNKKTFTSVRKASSL